MTPTTSSGHDLTPQQRLAHSRSALVNYMTQGDRSASGPSHAQIGTHAAGQNHSKSSVWYSIKRAVQMWWQHHPAHMAMDVAKPVLGNYAREKPLRLLGIAAGAGAVAVFIRPWRLVSITGLLFAAVKSTEFSGLLMSLLSTKPETTPTTKDMP